MRAYFVLMFVVWWSVSMYSLVNFAFMALSAYVGIALVVLLLVVRTGYFDG